MIDINILNNKLNKLKKRQAYIKIFKLILKENIPYSKNQNGIYFNLSLLDETILSQIEFICNTVLYNANS